MGQDNGERRSVGEGDEGPGRTERRTNVVKDGRTGPGYGRWSCSVTEEETEGFGSKSK